MSFNFQNTYDVRIIKRMKLARIIRIELMLGRVVDV